MGLMRTVPLNFKLWFTSWTLVDTRTSCGWGLSRICLPIGKHFYLQQSKYFVSLISGMFFVHEGKTVR